MTELKVFNLVFMEPEVVFMTAIRATAINAAMRPYSMAVAPVLFRAKL